MNGGVDPDTPREDRLDHIRRLLKERTAYWSVYNPRSSYLYDVEEAGDDIRWLVAEIERLGGEVKRFAGTREGNE